MRLARSIPHFLFTAGLDPEPDGEVVTLVCGSSTLVLERLVQCGTRRMVACDTSPVVIDAAVRDQRAARLKGGQHLRGAAQDHPTGQRRHPAIVKALGRNVGRR